MNNKPNEKIKRIINLIGDEEAHFPLRVALSKLQIILDMVNDEGSLLESIFECVSAEIQIRRVLDNYLLRHNPDEGFVDKLLVIVNDMSEEQVEQLRSSEVSATNHRPAYKWTPDDQFEYDVKRINKKINLSKDSNGGYVNEYVRLAWHLRRKQYFRITGNLAARRKVHGPYYVARRDENSRLNFSEIPTPHKSYDRAEAEAKRLANKTKFNFTVLNEVGTYGPDTE